MKYFAKMIEDFPVQALLDEITSVDDAWNLNRGRQWKIAVQREAMSIPIRGLRKSKIQGRKKWDVHESRFTTISRNFPRIRSCLETLSATLQGELSRAKVVKLAPGHRVYSHIDRGEYYRIRHRYHLVLKSEEGNYLKAGDEQVWMQPGEVWWFDNKALHEAENASNADRIHFIFDLKPLRP